MTSLTGKSVGKQHYFDRLYSTVSKKFNSIYTEQQLLGIPNIISIIGQVYQVICDGVNGIVDYQSVLTHGTDSSEGIGKMRVLFMRIEMKVTVVKSDISLPPSKMLVIIFFCHGDKFLKYTAPSDA